MSHHTKDKGDLAVAKVIAHLLEHDIRVCLPLSEHLPFDFIAVMPDMKTLKRVQVKYAADPGTGAIQALLRATRWNTKRVYAVTINFDNIDAYALYCPDTDEQYYLRADELALNASTISLRIREPQNGQQKGIRLAKNYVSPYRLAHQDALVLKQSARSVHLCDERKRAWFIKRIMEQGLHVCIPHSHHIPFDLVVVMPDMKTLFPIVINEIPNYVDFRVDLTAMSVTM